MKNRVRKTLLVAALFWGLFLVFGSLEVSGAGLLDPNADVLPHLSIELGVGDDPQSTVAALQVLFLVSIIALAPSLLVLLTSFTRIIIVLSFTRQAMATQQMPPNQVLVGIAIFLTLFVMAPQLSAINENAIVPFGAGEIDMPTAIDEAWMPLESFMLRQLGASSSGRMSVNLFMGLSDTTLYYEDDRIPASVLIPAFILNELTMGFFIGFLIYLPFIVVDMVVASVLMSMGMMMLPPAMISMPFKIMVFVLAGGWSRVIEYMLQAFYFY